LRYAVLVIVVVAAAAAAAATTDGRLQYLGMRSQNLLKLVETLLQLSPVAGSEAGLPALLVLARSTIAGAPTARRLASITFHL
jgi:hypothetical protein